MIIIFIGMPGSGKTTTASIMAQKLGYKFLDLDEYIISKNNKSIAEIFNQHGEDFFRLQETLALKEVFNTYKNEDLCLSIGGGAFLKTNNQTMCLKYGKTIWLNSSLNVIYNRINNQTHRPLLQGNLEENLQRLYKDRVVQYSKADLIYDIKEEKSKEEIVSAIIDKMNLVLSIDVKLGKIQYPIYLKHDALDYASSFLDKTIKHMILVVDKNIPQLHVNRLLNSLVSLNAKIDIVYIKVQEKNKNLKNAFNLCEKIINLGINRQAVLLSFGGGVLGDMVGFCASIILRGIPFINIPTTLLSQVDSSVGGKTGVNVKNGKNLVGTFYQPKLVLIDTKVLKSLSDKDYISGYAEVLKYAILFDKKYFFYLDSNLQKFIAKDNNYLLEIIEKSCEFKSKIVSKDEKETKEIRVLLNLGHTFAHAFEAYNKYKPNLSHGQAVSIGILLAVKFSVALGYCDASLVNILEQHLIKVGLPTKISAIIKNIDINKIIYFMFKDKKTTQNSINLVLVKDFGECFFAKNIDIEKLRDFLTQEIK
jgi:shikimate kinase/3-dehydroquinate synthase